MKLPDLNHGVLLRRYKRFLADVQLPSGELLTLHCPNTGAMTGCAEAGDRVWFSTSSNPKRKYAYTWELTETASGDFICINTLRANQLAKEVLVEGWIHELAGYREILSEQKYGSENSRIDFLLKSDGLPHCFVEVKSTTLLAEQGLGMFPDAQTIRGQKHLRELIHIAQQGQRAVLLFAVLHSGIQRFDVARHIDPHYAALFDQAIANGVEPLVYKTDFKTQNGCPIAMTLTQKSHDFTFP